MRTKKADMLIIKPPLTPEMEKTVDEFIRALKQPVEGLKEKIECQVKYSESKEKGFDDDIERVEKVSYTFYDESSHEPLFEIRLENHSHTGKIARVAINTKFKDQIKEFPHFSIMNGYATEYYYTSFLIGKLLRK